MPDDAARIHALTAVAEALERRESKVQESVDDLRKSVDVQNLHNARKIGWAIGASAVAVILVALVLVGYLKQVETSRQQAETSARVLTLIEQQAQTSDRLEKLIVQVLCPLYKVLLGSYAPESRAAGPDRDKYEQVFTDMWNQYAVLQCVGDLVPPRADLVTKPPK